MVKKEKLGLLDEQTQLERSRLREILARNNIVQQINETIQYQRKLRLFLDVWVVVNADETKVLLTDTPPKGDIVIKIIPFEEYNIEDLLEVVYGKQEKELDPLFERFITLRRRRRNNE
ncbi:MAG: hypothetical protein QXV35_06125 [Archaeoglobaceae archaeon]